MEDLAVEGGDFGSVSSRSGVVECDGGGAGGLEAEVDVEDAEEAAQEQARADEEDAGEGDLRDDEGSAEAAVRGRRWCCGRIFERVLDVAAGDIQAGDEAEEDAGGDGDEEGPGEGCACRCGCLRGAGARWSPDGRGRRQRR